MPTMTPEMIPETIEILFFISASVALISALLAVTRRNAVHALLYLVITMMAIALIFFLLGASFAAALQIIIYAGAVMVLFVFVTMMLHQGERTLQQERMLFQPMRSFGATFLCMILFAELVYLLLPLSGFLEMKSDEANTLPNIIGAKEIGLTLFGPYLLLVEISALLLLTALIGAFHLGRRHQETSL